MKNNIIKLMGFYSMCSIMLCMRADLFDLYELGHFRAHVPEHIQKEIIAYYNSCTCSVIEGITEEVTGLEFIDPSSIKVLTNSSTYVYKIRMHKQHYYLDCLWSANSQEGMPIVSGDTARIYISENTQVVRALTKSLVTSIQRNYRVGAFSLRGFFLRQHMSKGYWYLCTCIEQLVWYGATDEPGSIILESVPFDDISKEIFYAALVLDAGVQVFKSKGNYFEHYTSLPHPAPVTAVAFSHDHTQVITACKDNKLRIWSLFSVSASTLEQLLLVKLLDTAYYHEGFWDFDNLARRLQVSLSKNLSDQTHAGVVAYLAAVFKTLTLEDQLKLRLVYNNSIQQNIPESRHKITKSRKKQHKCIVC